MFDRPYSPVAVSGGPDGGGRAADCSVDGVAAILVLIVALLAKLEDGLDLPLEAVDIVVNKALQQCRRVQ